MMGASTLPYGADSHGMKWLLRFMCGTAYGISASVVNLWNRRFILTIIVLIISLITNIGLGVYNPLNAMAEQFVIGFIMVFLPALSVIKKS